MHSAKFRYVVRFVNIPQETAKIKRYIIFLLDVFGSVYPNKIETLKLAMGSVLDSSLLKEHDPINILSFGDSVNKVWPVMVNPTLRTNNDSAKKFIKERNAYGRANVYQALTEALEMLQLHEQVPSDAPGSIISLTDGVPTTGQDRKETIVKEIQYSNKYDQFLVVSLAYRHDVDALKFMKSLSARNFRFVRIIEGTDDARMQIQNAIKETGQIPRRKILLAFGDGGETDKGTENYCPFALKETEFVVAGDV